MKNELLVMKREDKILTVKTEDGRVCNLLAENMEKKSFLGDIYIGKVRNVVKNINAAFVEFQKGEMGYLALDGICPVHTDGTHYQEGRVLIGDEIIVQVEKEAVKTKPPTLSGSLNLPGKYIVLISGDDRVSVSSKIKDKQKKEELRGLLHEYASEEYGFIARTNSAKADKATIVKELNGLIENYRKIVDFGRHKAIYNCLYQGERAYLCNIRDAHNDKLDAIITDDGEIYQEISDYLEKNSEADKEKLVLWDEAHGKLDAVYNVSKTIEHALMPKVWLKNGAYLIIQPTEALVAIDVNTGKAISKKKDVQKTFFKVNMEAAKEIAHQLRLRNLSGMILIDFIDMTEKAYNEELMECLKMECAKDPVRTTVIDMTKLGLVEVTRKKVRKSLFEQLRD